jgi:Fatty acid synthesis protein
MLGGMRESVDYIGYVEGRDINRGKADVVVTDGFTGNVALKTMEGFASFLLGNLRDVFGSTFGRIAYLLVRKRLGALRERLDPSEYGGAPLLGLGGVTIIAHGSSNPRAIRNAIRAAANEALVERVNAEIVEILARHVSSMPVKSAGKGFRALLDRMRERLHRHPREGGANAEHPKNVEHPGAHAPAPAATAVASAKAVEAKVVEPKVVEVEALPPPEPPVSLNGVAGPVPHADDAHDEPHKTVEAQTEALPQSEMGPQKPEPS